MRIIQLFYKRFFWFAPLWYGFTMFLTRWRRWPEIATYTRIEQINEALSWGEGWRPDPIKGLLDVAMDPRKFQARIDRGETKLGDCDDHALYWAAALLDNGLAERAWIGSAFYARRDGKGKAGHVVCLFERDGKRYWVDYRAPRSIDAAWGWAYSIALDRGKLLYAAGTVEVVARKRRLKFRIRGHESRTV